VEGSKIRKTYSNLQTPHLNNLRHTQHLDAEFISAVN